MGDDSFIRCAGLRKGRRHMGEVFSFWLAGNRIHLLSSPKGHEAAMRATLNGKPVVEAVIEAVPDDLNLNQVAVEVRDASSQPVPQSAGTTVNFQFIRSINRIATTETIMVFAVYMMTGPNSIRTLLRSLVARDIKSPVLFFW